MESGNNGLSLFGGGGDAVAGCGGGGGSGAGGDHHVVVIGGGNELRQRNVGAGSVDVGVVIGGDLESGGDQENHHHCDHERKVDEADGNGGNSSTDLAVYEWKRDGISRPPNDDCCPICFGHFNVPCRTSCGHWYCANCILQFWNYRQDLQKCKCPICSRRITKLTPQHSSIRNSQEKEDVVEILQNVNKYNRLYQGGIYGFIGTVLASPVIMKRMLWALMEPNRFGTNYLTLRVIAMVLSAVYNLSHSDFTLAGYMETRSTVDIFTVAFVASLSLMGMLRRLILKYRVRRLAATRAHV